MKPVKIKGINSKAISKYMALKAAAQVAYELRTVQIVQGEFSNSWPTRLNRGEIGDFTPGDFSFSGGKSMMNADGHRCVSSIKVMYTGTDPVPHHGDDWGIEDILGSPAQEQLPLPTLANDHILIGLIDDVRTAEEMLKGAIDALLDYRFGGVK